MDLVLNTTQTYIFYGVSVLAIVLGLYNIFLSIIFMFNWKYRKFFPLHRFEKYRIKKTFILESGITSFIIQRCSGLLIPRFYANVSDDDIWLPNHQRNYNIFETEEVAQAWITSKRKFDENFYKCNQRLDGDGYIVTYIKEREQK